MSALISIVQNYGSGYAGSQQEVAKNLSYMISQDSGIVNKLVAPITRPAESIEYSYEVYIRCRCDLAPDNYCNNFKAYYNSGLGDSGIVLTVNSDVVSNYQQPVNTVSTRGDRVDFSTKDVNDKISLYGELTNVGDYTSWLVFQLGVSSSADLGNGEVDYTIEYDEY